VANDRWATATFETVGKVVHAFESIYTRTVFARAHGLEAGPVGTLSPLPDALGGDQKWRPALQAVVTVSKDSFFELLRAKAHFLMLPETIATTLKETSRVQLFEDSAGVLDGLTEWNEEAKTASIHIPKASEALVHAASSLGRDNNQNLKILETLYHESTHAWIDLREFYEDDDAFQQLYANGLDAYQSATTATKTPVPAKLAFSEAAAYYVGDKIARWCKALYDLDVLSRDKPQAPGGLDFELESIAIRYDKFVPTYGKVVLAGEITSPELSIPLRDAIDKKILDGLPLTQPFSRTPLADLRNALSPS
jgi:hypothetical protein